MSEVSLSRRVNDIPNGDSVLYIGSSSRRSRRKKGGGKNLKKKGKRKKVLELYFMARILYTPVATLTLKDAKKERNARK